MSILIKLVGCGNALEMRKEMQGKFGLKEIESIKDSTYTKTEMNKELRIMGLEAEKRMIQATDRKLMDVQRQTQIEEEINTLKK